MIFHFSSIIIIICNSFDSYAFISSKMLFLFFVISNLLLLGPARAYWLTEEQNAYIEKCLQRLVSWGLKFPPLFSLCGKLSWNSALSIDQNHHSWCLIYYLGSGRLQYQRSNLSGYNLHHARAAQYLQDITICRSEMLLQGCQEEPSTHRLGAPRLDGKTG